MTQKEASAQSAKTKKMHGVVPEKVNVIDNKVVGKSDACAAPGPCLEEKKIL